MGNSFLLFLFLFFNLCCTLVCEKRGESKIAVIEHKHIPNLNQVIHQFRKDGYTVSLSKSDNFTILLTDRKHCPEGSNSTTLNFLNELAEKNLKLKKMRQYRFEAKEFFIVTTSALVAILFFAFFCFQKIAVFKSKVFYADTLMKKGLSFTDFLCSIVSFSEDNGKLRYWREFKIQFSSSIQLRFNVAQEFDANDYFEYDFNVPIIISSDEYEDIIDSTAKIHSSNKEKGKIEFSFQDSKISLTPSTDAIMKPDQNTTHYFLLNMLFSGMMWNAVNSVRTIDDVMEYLTDIIDQLDLLGIGLYTFYKEKFKTLYNNFNGNEKINNIAKNEALNVIANSKESPTYEEYQTIEYFRVCSFSTKFGFTRFVIIFVRNNNLMSFRLSEKSLFRTLSNLISGFMTTIMPSAGLVNIKRFKNLVEIHKTIDLVMVNSDITKTIKKIGKIDNSYILSQIENLSSGERRLWENKISCLQEGTAFYQQQCKARFYRTASTITNEPIISFAIQKKPRLNDPLLQLASYQGTAYFRKDGSLVCGNNFLGTPFTVNNMADIVGPGNIPAHDSYLKFQISTNVTKTAFMKAFQHPKNLVSGFLFPIFEDQPDCLNVVELADDQRFMIWLLDSSKFYPVWMLINKAALPSLAEYTVDGLYSICHPDDVATLKSSMDHALSVYTVSLTMELRLKIVTDDYEWHQIMINRRAGQFILFFAMNIDEWKSQISLLQEMDQSLTTALSYGQVINWVFEDNYFPQRVYTNEPISKNHVVFNWTTIEHNVPGEYYEYVANALKKTLETGNPLRFESPKIFDDIKWYSTYANVDTKSGVISGLDFDITALKEAEQQAAMQKRAAEEATAAKAVFLANMTHEIRTPLNGICGLIELLQSSPLDKEKLEMVEVVHNAFKKLMDLLTDTLELAKIEQGKMIPMSVVFDPLAALTDISKIAATLSQQNKIPIYSKTDPKLPRLIKGDPKFLAKIVSILISNAFKFTTNGHVKIYFTYVNDNGILIVVKDTGIGMTDDIKERIYGTFTQGDSSVTRKYGGIGVGLALVKRMLDLIGGTIKYESEVNVGTRFEVFFPAESIYELYVPPRLKNKHLQIYLNCFHNQHKAVKMMTHYASYFGFEVIDDVNRIDYDHISLIFASDNDQDQINFALKIREKVPTLMIAMINSKGELIQKPGFTSITRPISIQTMQRIMIQLLWGKKAQKKEEVLVQGLKILSADENMTSAFVIKTLLERLDCNVVLANNGAEVIEICQKQTFDVILVDHHMPIMDGPTSIGIIRKLDSPNAKVPIIFMSSTIADNEPDIYKKLGADYFLVKPVTQQKLYDLLQIVCRNINYQAFQ